MTQFKVRFYLLVTVVALIGLGGTVFVAQKITSLISNAASNTSFEAESGTLTGSASIGNDSTASNGKYLVFNSGTTNTNFQPSAPYYGTFYYMWYKNQATDGQWSYWTDHGNNPPSTWFSHYIPDPEPNVFDPTNELYSANSYSNFKWQVSKMAEAKIEFSIASWWGQGTREDVAFNNIINSFMGRADNPYPNLRWAMYYEDEGFSDPSTTTIVGDLNYIKTKYAQSPYFLKVNGKPVIFVYAGANDNPGTMTQRWHDANAQTGGYFYIVLKVFPGFATDPNQPDSWHQYSPAVRSDVQGNYSYMVSPGFWLDDGSAVRLPRDANAFQSAVQGMVSANTTWKLVETWNEWGEGTSVEPGEQVVNDPTTGNEVIDPSAPVFGNTYIDILKNSLPNLEGGTGANAVSATSSPVPTTSSNGSDPVIAADGDIACGVGSAGASCQQNQTANLLKSINPNAVLLLGDNQYEEGALSDYQNYFDSSWGQYKNITFPSVGNHEYLTSGASGYFDYFNGVGNQNGKAGARNQGYYAFNLGTWRIYALNSNCSEAGGCGAGSPQEQWLRNDLAANPRKCVMAFFHHPLFTSGTRAAPSVKPLYQALYDNGADVILNGHEHNYERFDLQDPNGVADPNKGIREFVVGSGGRNFTSFVTTAANSQMKNDKTFGVLKMVLHPDSYDFQFLPIAGSSFSDSGITLCH